MPYSDDEIRARLTRLESVLCDVLDLLDRKADALGLSARELTTLKHYLGTNVTRPTREPAR